MPNGTYDEDGHEVRESRKRAEAPRPTHTIERFEPGTPIDGLPFGPLRGESSSIDWDALVKPQLNKAPSRPAGTSEQQPGEKPAP